MELNPQICAEVSNSGSPEAALDRLRRIQHHRVSINSAAPITGVSTINDEQADVFAALKLKRPTNDLQMNLL